MNAHAGHRAGRRLQNSKPGTGRQGQPRIGRDASGGCGTNGHRTKPFEIIFLGLEDDKFWKILSISVNGKNLPHWSKGLPAIQIDVEEESIELCCRRTTRIKGRTKRRWRVVGKQWQEIWRTLLSKPFNHNRLGFGVVRCRVLRSIQQFSRYCAFVMSGHNQLNRADYRKATLMKFFFSERWIPCANFALFVSHI